MRPRDTFLVVALPLVLLAVLGCASRKPGLDAVQSKQVSLREDIFQLEGRVEKVVGRLEELEKRITFLEGNLTANMADLQRSVDELGGRLDGQEAETSKKLEALSANLTAVSAAVNKRLEAAAAEKKELLKTIEEAKSSSFTTGYEHVVESGETLVEIAKSYGVTVEAIVEANDLGDPDSLKIGQKLFLPKQ